jgi:hypothetical protein
VKFADNAVIKLTSQGNAQMTGNQNGAVYKFAAATIPANAVTADPASVTIHLAEGYSGRPITYINLASVGTTTVTSVVAVEGDTDLIDVSCDGMTVAVMPAGYDLAVGRYNTVIYIQDEYGSVYTTVPVTINVGEPAASNITVNCIGDIDYTVSGKTVTVDSEAACKVGYLSDGEYVAVSATANGDGTYSFTAPDSVTEVVLILNGDIDGNSAVDSTDLIMLKRILLNTYEAKAEYAFAADTDGVNGIGSNDYIQMKRHLINTYKLSY